MDNLESSTLMWISRRNAENWIIENPEIIVEIKESSETIGDITKFMRSQGYNSKHSIMMVLTRGERYGVLQRKSITPPYNAKIELTDLGLELYKTMILKKKKNNARRRPM